MCWYTDKVNIKFADSNCSFISFYPLIGYQCYCYKHYIKHEAGYMMIKIGEFTSPKNGGGIVLLENVTTTMTQMRVSISTNPSISAIYSSVNFFGHIQ